MAEMEVERTIERLFARAPECPDADLFAERVQKRLDRGWAARRVLIGAAGLVGGVIGASQLIMSNLFSRAEAASTESARVLTSGVRQARGGGGRWRRIDHDDSRLFFRAARAWGVKDRRARPPKACVSRRRSRTTLASHCADRRLARRGSGR